MPSSRPKVIPTRTTEALAERLMTLHRQSMCGRHIAEQIGVLPTTASRVLRRAGLSRLRDLAPQNRLCVITTGSRAA